MKRIFLIQHPSGKYLVGDESPQPIAEDRFHAGIYSMEQVAEFQRQSADTFLVTEATAREMGTFYGRIGGAKVTPAKAQANRQRQIIIHRKRREAKKIEIETRRLALKTKRLAFEEYQKTRPRTYLAKYGQRS